MIEWKITITLKDVKLRRKDPEMIRSSLKAQPYQGKTDSGP